MAQWDEPIGRHRRTSEFRPGYLFFENDVAFDGKNRKSGIYVGNFKHFR